MIDKKGWEKKRFDEVFDLQMGKTPSRNNNLYWTDGQSKWISIADLKNQKYITSTKECITDLAVLESGIKKIPTDTVIMSFKLSIGKTSITTEDIYSNEAIMAFHVRNGFEIIPEYLFHYLNSYDWGTMNRAVMGSTLNKATISSKKINLPPLPIQQQIVSELDTLSDIISKKKQQLADLDILAQATFYDMFGDPVSNEKGWDFKTIEQIVIKDRHSIKRGPFGGALKKEIFVESGYLVYEQYHALNNDFTFARYFIKESDFQNLKAFEVHSGDIIVSCSGVYLGKLAIVPKDSVKGIINQALLKITLDNRIMDNRFFVFVFSNENFKRRYYGNTIGSGIPNFPPMSDFKKFKFICPSIQLQNQFSERIDSIEEQKSLINKSLADVQHLFDYTMDRYFN
ncbi:MAG: restriction endonuclease subunit S [Paludibacter sp.]